MGEFLFKKYGRIIPVLFMILGAQEAKASLAEDAFLSCDEMTTASSFCESSDTRTFVGDKSYRIASGFMHGMTDTATPVEYKAPITVMFPEDCRQQSGIAIADMINNTGTILLTLDGAGFFPPTPMGRAFLGDDYIGKRGHVLASLQYQGNPQDAGTDVFAISKGAGYYPAEATAGKSVADARSIMSDSSLFLKNLESHIPGACSSEKVLSFGYSRSAGNLNTLLAANNTTQVFDGNLIGGVGASAAGINSNLSLNRKTIVVNTETDVMLKYYVAGLNARSNAWSFPNNYRLYEIAGAAHNPIELIDLSTMPGGSPESLRQNPAKISPVMRSMMDHLAGWVANGETPPSNAVLDISGCEDRTDLNYTLFPTFPGGGLPGEAFLDEVSGGGCLRGEDGALLGGIRLPFVTTQVGKRKAGAPLGIYTGIETNTPWYLMKGATRFVFRSVGLTLSGSFQMDDDLLSTYDNHGRYVSSTARAAEHALSQGWINEEDKDWYVETAANCPVGLQDSSKITADDILACHGY